MRARASAWLVCWAAALSLCAQTNLPAPREELILTGITDLSSYKRAFFRVESPGAAPQTYTLAEGQNAGDITVLTIDSHKAKVTLRYRENVRELLLNSRLSGQASPTTAEQQRDVSHSTHHRLRAQLDRERDREGDGQETPRKKAGEH
jgi:hypothetical protein